MDEGKIRSLFIEKLGASGRIISMSKSGYRERNPKNAVIFNANVVMTLRGLKEFEKVWYGDLDITKDEVALREIASEMNMELYVLYEMDARFENETKPNMGSYAFMSDAGDAFEVGPKYKDYFVRDIVSGGLVRSN
jgi:hypothetical protein